MGGMILMSPILMEPGMLKRWIAMLCVVSLVATACAAQKPARAAKKAQKAEKAEARQGRAGPWKLSVQLYTFNKFPFVEAIDKAKSLDLKYVEGFSWQKIGAAAGDAELNWKAPAEAIGIAKKKLADAGIHMVNYYVNDFGKDQAEMRKTFEFAKSMGVETFVAEPSSPQLDVLAKLAKEFKINIAIHNHPKDPKKKDYDNWSPKHVMALAKDFDERIGACADTGHWVRSGLDPVQALKEYKGRLITLHLKDLNEKGPEGKDVPLGTGVSDVKAQLAELRREKFAGVISIEYEANMENNVEDVRASLDFIRKMAEGMGIKTE
jgi:sugar phosphate isomerase/epimerase